MAKASFVFWPGAEGRGFFRRAIDLCLNAGFEPHIVQEAQQMHAVLSLVAAEAGVAIVPASMASVRSEHIHYRAIDDPAAAFELCWCWRADRDMPAATNFLALAHEMT
jgi:DNA-binding transcriptional LysR family regulator